MALKLSLKPGEKFVVNGAVIVNGDRRASLIIQNKVSILRERDVMTPEEASSPIRRVYFQVMMMYLDPQDEQGYYEEFMRLISEFMTAIRNPAALMECIGIIEDVQARRLYKGLMTCRKLFAFEDERLGHVPATVSSDADGH
jgi:flagellar biosynthesis repressor protein FlbT